MGNGIDKFEAWRWKTRANVTRSLSRMQAALQAACQQMGGPVALGGRDAATSAAMHGITGDTQFWRRNDVVAEILGELIRFSAWLRACPYHEQQLLSEKLVECDCKGCRASEIAGRVRQCREAVRAQRERWVRNEPVHKCFTTMLSMLVNKFAWVSDLPFLIWEVRCPAIARQFLTTCDRAVVEGQVLHRVSAHFAGRQVGSLREQMGAFACGRGMSDELSAEVTSDALCKLNDTWADA